MSLQLQIKEQLKDAMRAKDTVRLGVIRGLLTAFTNELVATKRMPTDELRDEEILTLIRRQVKQRKDSIEQFKKGNREDLVAVEEAEQVILETYLPAQISREEVMKVAETKKKELGITDKSKAGQLMGAVMKELKSKTDGETVKSVVDGLLT